MHTRQIGPWQLQILNHQSFEQDCVQRLQQSNYDSAIIVALAMGSAPSSALLGINHIFCTDYFLATSKILLNDTILKPSTLLLRCQSTAVSCITHAKCAKESYTHLTCALCIDPRDTTNFIKLKSHRLTCKNCWLFLYERYTSRFAKVLHAAVDLFDYRILGPRAKTKYF